jgi:hypothetical protein
MVKAYILVEMDVRTDKASGIPVKKIREKFYTTKTTNTVMLIFFS